MGIHHSGSGGIQREYDWSNISPVVAVLESIAVFEHGDPGKTGEVLDSPLQTYVETDALETIATSDKPVAVNFSTPNYRIQVHRDTVSVTAAERPA